MSDLVKPKRELAKRVKIAKIVNKIVKLLEDIPSNEINEMRNHPDLIKYICNLVENLNKKKYKPDKKKIVFDIMRRVIPNFSANDEKIVSDIIEFLHGNGDIKKIRIIKYLGKYGIGFLKYLIPIASNTS
jgi:hypothetical protein